MYFDLLNTTNTLSSRLVSLEAVQWVQSSTLDYRVFSTATPGCDPFLICFLFGSLNFWREDSNHSYEYDCFKGPWGSHCDSIWDHIYKT